MDAVRELFTRNTIISWILCQIPGRWLWRLTPTDASRCYSFSELVAAQIQQYLVQKKIV